MGSLRRILISFVVLFDILGFGITFIIMSNVSTAAQADLIYMAESDATFTSVIALVGVFANLALGYTLLRGGIAARRLDAQDGAPGRTRITGE